MMHKMKTFALTAAIFAAAAFSAGATTVTVLGQSAQDNTNGAGIDYAVGYGANDPAGSSWTGSPTVQTGNSSGVYQSPFNSNTHTATDDFFAVGGAAPSPVTLNFGGDGVTAFNILWGSIDNYNTLTFSNGDIYTGDAIAALLTPPQSGQSNYENVALLHFAFKSAVTTATFSSSQAAFEFALAPVPLPAGGLLLLGAMGGLTALRRRKSV